MANHDIHPLHRDIQPPVFREPEALVENIYPIPGTAGLPNLIDQDMMGEYLIDRFIPDEGPRIRLVWTPSGYTLPGIERVPAGVKEVSRWRKVNPKEWLISPRTAGAIMLGSMALFNTVGNHDTISGALRRTGHEIRRLIDPVEDTTVSENHTTVTPGPVRNINVFASTSNRVGQAEADPAIIQNFVTQVAQAEQQGDKVLSIKIVGNTSDDWREDSSIGIPDSGNEVLGMDRARAAQAEAQAQGLAQTPAVEISGVEHIVTEAQKAEILALATANGFTSIEAAIVAVDSGQDVPEELRLKIEALFTGGQNRGVSLTAGVQKPGQDQFTTITETRTIPGVDHKPEVPKPRWYWFIPMFPIRWRERYDKVKQQHRWNLTPSKEIMRPHIIIEEDDQAWVRLRPEAINDDGSFVDNSWAYNRKYEHLLKDGRITDVLRADFNNPKGEAKSLRVMFVDEAPAQETVDLFERLLTKFAAMENGKLGDRVRGIFVYLSENAGTEHGDPRRVAMGIDKQSPEEILGTFTYVLDLVELHMPSTWDPEELEAIFSAFNGTAWVASHEVAGHGTDESDEPLRARPVRSRTIANAHLIDGEPRARKMSRLANALRHLPRRALHKDEPILFDISYPVLDNNGQTVTMHARVDEHDARLRHATTSTIVGYEPTQYAGQNASEHYAETAAAMVTGIAVPYSEAMVNVATLQTDNGQTADFATGYRPDANGQDLYRRSIGAAAGSFPVSFKKPPEVRITHQHPANDPFLRDQLIRTSRLATLEPHEMKAILARVVRTKRRDH